MYKLRELTGFAAIQYSNPGHIRYPCRFRGPALGSFREAFRMRTKEEVRAEVHALWVAVFGEPPIVEAPPRFLLEVLVGALPPAHYTEIGKSGAGQARPDVSGDAGSEAA